MIPYQAYMGRVCADPDLRNTNQSQCCHLRLAMNNSRKTPQGDWETTDTCFLTAVVWDEEAEAAAGLRKGDQVMLWGQLVTREWSTKQGEKRTSMELRARSVWVPARSSSGVSHPSRSSSSWGSPGPQFGAATENPPF